MNEDSIFCELCGVFVSTDEGILAHLETEQHRSAIELHSENEEEEE